MDRWNQEVFRKFSMHYPVVADKVVDQIYIGDGECMFTLSDNYKVRYDVFDNNVSYIYPRTGNPTRLTEEEWLQEFSRRLRKKMWMNDVTQKQLSKEINISERMVSKFVNGKKEPGYYIVSRIASYLKCDVRELTDFDYLL